MNINLQFEDALDPDAVILLAASNHGTQSYGDHFKSGLKIVESFGVDISLDTDLDLLELADLEY